MNCEGLLYVIHAEQIRYSREKKSLILRWLPSVAISASIPGLMFRPRGPLSCLTEARPCRSYESASFNVKFEPAISLDAIQRLGCPVVQCPLHECDMALMIDEYDRLFLSAV